MTRLSSYLASICATACLLAFSCSAAFGAGTAAGTPISNSATLTYDVSGVSQSDITSPAAVFVVDNKINLTVLATDANAVTVTPGQLAAVTTFKVSNNGNAVQDYALIGGNAAGTPSVFGLADNFDATSCNTFVESLAVPNGYTPGVDIATFIDELAPDASQTVYVVCNIPTGLLSGAQAVTELTAVTRAGGAAGLGATLTQSGANNQAAVDIVFADPATPANVNGTTPLQIAGDATGFARDAYRIAATTVIINKTATCSPTPANCSEAKTGTVITYKIQVDITGNGTAGALVVTDPLPTDVTFVPSSLNVTPALISPQTAAFSAGTVTVNFGDVAVTPTTPKTFIITLKASIN